MSTRAYAAASQLSGCEFGLCQRAAELEVAVTVDTVPVLVCGLHLTPLIVWGVAEPTAPPVIRVLATQPRESAA